jgi:hypothetical protein
MSRSFRSLVGIVALISAALFSAVAGGQYWFLSHQLRKETTDNLQSLSDDMREDIAFSDAWNLEGYRRISSGPDIYVLLTSNGTLIDFHGYQQGMLSRVSFPFRFEYQRPFQFSSEVGEKWNLYVHRLSDGLVILGAREEISPPDINERFAKNAARFGSSVGEATKTPERAIDEVFDFAVLDSVGDVRWGMGGIPLKTAAPEIPDRATLAPVRHFSGSLYSSFVEPVTSKSGQTVGVIRVFEDVTDEQRVLHQSAIFNVAIAAFLWSLTVGAAAMYLKHGRASEISCAQIPFLEEGETVEFKSSLRWDYNQKKPNADLEKVVVKAVVGFLNSETGGNLIVGVDDRKQVLGLEPDYSTLNTRPNRDGFEQKLQQVLISAIGERCYAKWVKVRFCSKQEKDFCIITVAPATEAIYPREKGSENTLFVRIGNTTRPLNPREAVAYAAARWGGLSVRRPYFRAFSPRPAS